MVEHKLAREIFDTAKMMREGGDVIEITVILINGDSAVLIPGAYLGDSKEKIAQQARILARHTGTPYVGVLAEGYEVLVKSDHDLAALMGYQMAQGSIRDYPGRREILFLYLDGPSPVSFSAPILEDGSVGDTKVQPYSNVDGTFSKLSGMPDVN